jgi:hypothetical protein
VIHDIRRRFRVESEQARAFVIHGSPNRLDQGSARGMRIAPTDQLRDDAVPLRGVESRSHP